MIPFRRQPSYFSLHRRCFSHVVTPQDTPTNLHSSCSDIRDQGELGIEIDDLRCAQHGRLGCLFPPSNQFKKPIKQSITPDGPILAKLNQLGIKKLGQLETLLFPDGHSIQGLRSSEEGACLDRIGGGCAKDVLLPDQGLGEKQCADMVHKIMSLNNPSFYTFSGEGAHNATMPAVLYNRLYRNTDWLKKGIHEAHTKKLPGTLEALHTYQSFIEHLTTMEMACLGIKDLITACWLAASACRTLSRQRFSRGERKIVLLETSMELDLRQSLSRRLTADGFHCMTIDLDHGSLPDLTKTAAVIVQGPNRQGQMLDLSNIGARAKAQDCKLILISDPLALCIHQEPCTAGVNVVIGSGQRLGYPVAMADMSAVYMAGDRSLMNCTGTLYVEQKGLALGKPEYNIRQLGNRHRGDHIACGLVFTAPLMPMLINLGVGLSYGLSGLQGLASRIFKKTAELAYTARELGYSVQGETSWFRTGEHFGVFTIHKRSVRVLNQFCKQGNTNIKIHPVEDYARIHVDEYLLDDHIEHQHIKTPLQQGAHELSLFSCSSLPFAVRPLVSRPTFIPSESPFKHLEGDDQLAQWLSHLERLDNKISPKAGVLEDPVNLSNKCTSTSSYLFESVHPRAPHDQQLGRLLLTSLVESFLRGVTGLDFVSLHPIQSVYALVDLLRSIRAWQTHNHKNINRDLCLYVNHEATLTTRSILMSHLHPFPVQPPANYQAFQGYVSEILQTHSDRISSLILPYPNSKEGVLTFKQLTEIAHKCGISVIAFGGKSKPFISNGGMRYLGFDATLLDPTEILTIPKAIQGEHYALICGDKKFVPFLPTPQWTSLARPSFKKMSLTVPGGEPSHTMPYSLLPSPLALQLWTTLMSTGRENLREESQLATLDLTSASLARTRSK